MWRKTETVTGAIINEIPKAINNHPNADTVKLTLANGSDRNLVADHDFIKLRKPPSEKSCYR